MLVVWHRIAGHWYLEAWTFLSKEQVCCWTRACSNPLSLGGASIHYIPLSPGCTCGGLFKKPYVQGFNLPWVPPFATLTYHYSLLRISYAETSFLKRGRGACKVLYKSIFHLHQVVSLDCESIFCAMELFWTCFVWLVPSWVYQTGCTYWGARVSLSAVGSVQLFFEKQDKTTLTGMLVKWSNVLLIWT